MARLGGKARWKGIGKRKRRELARAAVNARWDAARKRRRIPTSAGGIETEMPVRLISSDPPNGRHIFRR